MKDIYIKDVDSRINTFLRRKSEEYPELRIFDSSGPIDTQTKRRHDTDIDYRN
ncbi:MAG TPA: hypothetical protein VFK11_04275 [Candidatus Saccharimonadales bacterium]|nr:hypothetical protein [Candidatus Saccharimonadales bacterium]